MSIADHGHISDLDIIFHKLRSIESRITDIENLPGSTFDDKIGELACRRLRLFQKSIDGVYSDMANLKSDVTILLDIVGELNLDKGGIR